MEKNGNVVGVYSSVRSKRRNLMDVSSLLHAHVALWLGK